jgi:magnesium transporter
MHARRQYGDITWVDLESPHALEIRQVATEFNIAEHIAEELMLPSSRQRTEEYPHYAYVVMHFPAIKHSHRDRQQEIDFLLGKRFLVTVRYDTIDPLHKFSKILDVNRTLHMQPLPDHAGHLFFDALMKLYHSVEHEVDIIRGELTQIEEHIFSEREVAMVVEISKVARALLKLRQTIEPHREVLRVLETSGPRIMGSEFFPYLRALSNEYYRVHNHIMRATDFLHELRETNNSLLTTKQNETMKTFTILAFTTFPLTLVAALFSTRARGMPIVNSPIGFWIIVGLMLATASLMFLYFKRKKWL